MFSLKTILFAALAALAGVASAAPLVDAHAHADVDAVLRSLPESRELVDVDAVADVLGLIDVDADITVRSLPESGSSLVARCDTCNSVPAILTPAIVKLDGILAQASKWPFLASGDFPTHLRDRN